MLNDQVKNAENIALFHNRFILISGANSSLGRSIALELATLGAEMILMDQDPTALRNLSREIRAKHKISSLIYPLNLRNSNHRIYNRLLQKLEKKIPRLDAVILNAHYNGQNKSLLSYPFLLWKEVMQVNLDANFMLIQVLIPLLLKAKKPQLLFNLHNDALPHKEGWGAYKLAQSGLENLMKLCALEFNKSHLLVYGIRLASIYHPNKYLDKDITRIPFNLKTVKRIAALYPILLSQSHRADHGRSINLRNWSYHH